MSQNAQNLSGLHTHVHSFSDTTNEEDPLALVETLKILSCPICRAVYQPSSSHYADEILEDAFRGVCHFCFRCQRPSCPQCWNPIHHVCASCGEEAHLPFCSPVPDLEGLSFSPLAAPQAVKELKLSFTCLRNGQLYFPDPEPPSPPEPPRADPPAHTFPTTSDDLPIIQSRQTEQNRFDSVDSSVVANRQIEQVNRAKLDLAHSYPPWVQEVLGYKPAEVLPPENDQQHNEREISTSRYAQPAASSVVSPQVDQTNSLLVNRVLPQLPVHMPPASMLAGQEEVPSTEAVPMLDRIENALLIGTSSLLLVAGLIIALAMSSTTINTFFLHLLHIDIRSEVSYLLQLR